MASPNDPGRLDLLLRARARDGEAWDEIVREHSARLKRLAELRLDSRLAGRFDPEDLVQEALTDAFRSLETYFRDQEFVSFSYWLRQHLLDRVRRVHRDHLNTAKRSVTRERACRLQPDESRTDPIAGITDPGTSPSHGLTRSETCRMVHEALGRLSEIDREVLILFFFEDYSHREIGFILALEPDVVKARQHRASCHLASLLRRTHADWCHDAYPRTRTERSA
jgi:RNA polymerase sigma-70 factor (subfamily 1)